MAVCGSGSSSCAPPFARVVLLLPAVVGVCPVADAVVMVVLCCSEQNPFVG